MNIILRTKIICRSTQETIIFNIIVLICLYYIGKNEHENFDLKYYRSLKVHSKEDIIFSKTMW